jgi:hypothetical protein
MALPTTISGALWPTQGSGNLGPFLYGTSVYICTNDAGGVVMFKATDPTSSFSEVDASNAPTGASQQYYMDSYFDGTYIHVMWVTQTNPSTIYAKFDCSSDSWVDASDYGGIGGAHSRTLYVPSDSPTTFWGGITVRSDGDVIVVHPGENYSNMGGATQTVYYSRIEGTSLTAGTSVADSGGKNDNYLYAYVVMGSSDQCHFAYVRDTDSDFYLRALSSGNALRTQRTNAGTYGGVSRGVFNVRASDRICFSVYGTSTTIYSIKFTHFTDDSSPSFEEDIATTPSIATTHPFNGSLCNDTLNEYNYIANIYTGDSDIYIDSDVGTDPPSWNGLNSGSVIFSGITAVGVSANIFTRDNNRVFACLYNDSGTVKYDEFTLYAVSSATSKPFRRRAVRFAPMRF